MKRPQLTVAPLGVPPLLADAEKLVRKYRRLSKAKMTGVMKVSAVKAAEVQRMYAEWSVEPEQQSPAIDTFIGDIYSGLQVQSWSDDDRQYAQRHLLILSGLYGGLRACDGIMPYRLEMGYKLPDGSSMYDFWKSSIAAVIPERTSVIINLSAVEYTKALLPYLDLTVVTPKFLSISPKTGEPTFVTVHAKIARGAFARWLITQRIDDIKDLTRFNELGYSYDASLSGPDQPVFVAKTFGGIGLSVRLTT